VITPRMRLVGHMACMGERVLVGKPEIKRWLGRPRHRWENNIRMGVQEVGWGCMDWSDLVQGTDRWCNALYIITKFRFPQNAGNFLTSWGTSSFSKRTMLHAVSLLWAYTHLKIINKTHYSHTTGKSNTRVENQEASCFLFPTKQWLIKPRILKWARHIGKKSIRGYCRET
jgi:hypothetical protein